MSAWPTVAFSTSARPATWPGPPCGGSRWSPPRPTGCAPPAGADAVTLPTVAVVGRPNVGKSTLVNRFLGRRDAIVEERPGVTRDRKAFAADWNGRRFALVDTGGWEPRPGTPIAVAVASQAESAIKRADLVVFVVDIHTGLTDEDAGVVDILRRSPRPVLVAANKVDSAAQEAAASELWSLGLGDVFAVSALHGRGSG